MPIVITGQGTLSNGGTANFVSGGETTSLSSIKVSINGGTAVEVWKKSVTCTDLVKWNGWSTQGSVNTSAEAAAGLTGIQCISGASSVGQAVGKIYQNISMVNDHKYWLYYGTYSMDGFTVETPLGNASYSSGTQQKSQIVTYTGTSGSKQVAAYYSGSNDTSSAYGRLCNMNIVDLTASFGAGSEPTASWCATNLGIFNGSKTVIP